MKLHYSQTEGLRDMAAEKFDCYMKLHYSQTWIGSMRSLMKFDCYMKLHYSQTSNRKIHSDGETLPYATRVYIHIASSVYIMHISLSIIRICSSSKVFF